MRESAHSGEGAYIYDGTVCIHIYIPFNFEGMVIDVSDGFYQRPPIMPVLEKFVGKFRIKLRPSKAFIVMRNHFHSSLFAAAFAESPWRGLSIAVALEMPAAGWC